jgi:hypothetical protein
MPARGIGISQGSPFREMPRAGGEEDEIHGVRRRAPIFVRRAIGLCIEPLDLIAVDSTRHFTRERETFVPIRQVECGLIGALSAAAWGEIVLADGGDIVTQNFDRYPVVRMQSVPAIEVVLIDSDEPPSGVGEVSVPSTAPAVANAIAALTGTRIRRLPLSKSVKLY